MTPELISADRAALEKIVGQLEAAWNAMDGLLGPDVALVRVHSILNAPQGPLKGRHGARFSMVLTRNGQRVGDRGVSQHDGSCATAALRPRPRHPLALRAPAVRAAYGI